MCGIVGFVGGEQAAPILLDGLERLEYRGYDSAGIAVISGDKKLQVKKSKGRLKVLRDMIQGGKSVEGTIGIRLANLEEKTAHGALLPGTLGIGHTRWATHGEPNDVNAHPHLSGDGKIAVVHNGIIENYVELRDFLISNGYKFISDTDTEVVSQLVSFYYAECGNALEAVFRVLRRIEGAYALGILCVDEPEHFIAARKDAPLLIGYGEGSNYIASDVTAIIKHTRDVSYMEDGEVAVISADKVQFYNAMEQTIEKEHHTIDWDVSAAEKGGYAHFMLKEIMEQPEAIRKTAFSRIHDNRIVFEDMKFTAEQIKDVSRIFIIACGSSYHVGVVGKYNLERLMRKPVEVCLASEFRYSDPLVDDKTLVIVISQSGETLDTMAALREAKARGAHILSIVNVVGSSIARESDDVLYTWAGPEIAVATTKAYSAQLTALYMLAMKFAKVRGTIDQEKFQSMLTDLRCLPDQIELLLGQKQKIQHFANRYVGARDIFFIGRGIDYAISLEGSLKLKEISYIHSEAYAAGELKHGTISLIEDGTLVVALATQPALFQKTISNMVEVKARGAFVMAVTIEGNKAIEKAADYVVYIPETNPYFTNSLAIIPLQLFAYYVAVGRGCDVDKPRNLAKSVTVE